MGLALLVLVGMIPVRAAETPAAGKQVAQSLPLGNVDKDSIRYLLFLPADYVKQGGKKWPLMLFLHGAGERGDDLNRVTVHGPPKVVREKAGFPFVLVSPQCPSERIWDDAALLQLLDHILRTEEVDPGRVYLTGLSMGGFGTWSLASKYPERFAAVAPICGGGNTIEVLLAPAARVKNLQSLGVWAFHGAKDTVVFAAESELMVKAFQRQGCQDAQLTVYPEAGHDAWTQTYANPELYNWFLRHQR